MIVDAGGIRLVMYTGSIHGIDKLEIEIERGKDEKEGKTEERNVQEPARWIMLSSRKGIKSLSKVDVYR